MTQPITPPPKLVEKWIKSARYREFMPYPEGYEQYEQRLTTLAARWGADMELEACVEWLGDAPVVYNDNGDLHPGSYLRNARRPKPPSLKEQALETLKYPKDFWSQFSVKSMTDISPRRFYFQIKSANVLECVTASSLTEAKLIAADTWLQWWSELEWINTEETDA